MTPTRRRSPPRAKSDGGLVPTILRLCQLRRLWAWRVNSGTVLLASGHRITLAPPGTPDVLLVLPGGYLAGLEAKTPTGAVRTSQRAWARVAADHGVRYAVVRSAAEVVAVLDGWVREVERAHL
jgi:hypothetical protein